MLSIVSNTYYLFCVLYIHKRSFTASNAETGHQLKLLPPRMTVAFGIFNTEASVIQ